MRLRKTMRIRKPLVGVVSIAAAVAALSACVPISDNNYHGTVGAPTPISTVSTPEVPAYPITLSGNGEQVKTAELVVHGYTVSYQASSNCLSVESVRADGSDGDLVVNQCARGDTPAVSGTTTYRATGRTTFHVSNTDDQWSLTFTPLS
jgi:hypothetical protein